MVFNSMSILAGLACWIAAAFWCGLVPGLVVTGCILVGGPILVARGQKTT